ncbi:MAG: DNA repair protein RecN, partial [Deltaproteobacteria bacterium]|nr:DNA repair protein RecN [Deltaproteobacteria bacterium]
GYSRYQALKEEIHGLEREINEIGERQDLTRFQIQEIEGAMVVPGEDKSLAEERRRLLHAEELLALVSEGYQALYENSDSVLSLISQYRKKVEKGAAIDSRLGSTRDALAGIEARLEDASLSLRDFQQTIHMDPGKLDEVAERLELLNGLKRKYGSTLEEVLTFKDGLASTMVDLDEKKERLGRLREAWQELGGEIRERADALSGKRKEAAASMESEVEEELDHLHMAETQFKVKFDRAVSEGSEAGDDLTHEMRAEGWDRVEFMISPNVGEELRPLSKIASGGELSRIMLALKTILARSGSVETIIFDEVDSGISGATAAVIGEKLLALAEYHQMLCITHLPQIASQGENHFLVRKEVARGRTQTVISEMDDGARVQEIARLLGGKEITPAAVARAEEMLGQ